VYSDGAGENDAVTACSMDLECVAGDDDDDDIDSAADSWKTSKLLAFLSS